MSKLGALLDTVLEVFINIYITVSLRSIISISKSESLPVLFIPIFPFHFSLNYSFPLVALSIERLPMSRLPIPYPNNPHQSIQRPRNIQRSKERNARPRVMYKYRAFFLKKNPAITTFFLPMLSSGPVSSPYLTPLIHLIPLTNHSPPKHQ